MLPLCVVAFHLLPHRIADMYFIWVENSNKITFIMFVFCPFLCSQQVFFGLHRTERMFPIQRLRIYLTQIDGCQFCVHFKRYLLCEVYAEYSLAHSHIKQLRHSTMSRHHFCVDFTIRI